MKVLYLQYTSPANYPPLEHSGLILLSTGWDVHFFGIQSEGASSKLVFSPPLTEHLTIWPRVESGFRQKLHFIWFTLWALGMVMRRGSDWVYCSDLLSCPAAWLIGSLTRCHVLYHEHDSPEDGSRVQEDRHERIAKISQFQRFLLWTRKQVGRGADLVVLPNRKRMQLFVQMTGRQRTSLCVFNCPRITEVLPQCRVAGTDAKLRLAFHGSINQERLPMTLLEAMSRFPGRVHLSVVGYESVGSKGYMSQFLQAASGFGLLGNVIYIGAVATRRELLAQAETCDVGLAFMPVQGGDVNMANMSGASNKPFDYLACGLALLVSARPEWEEMFVQPGFGLSCHPGNVDSLVSQLGWFLEHPLATLEMGERGRRQILAEWNYETQFQSVFKTLNRDRNFADGHYK